jgi:hypothetical protein
LTKGDEGGLDNFFQTTKLIKEGKLKDLQFSTLEKRFSMNQTSWIPVPRFREDGFCENDEKGRPVTL